MEDIGESNNDNLLSNEIERLELKKQRALRNRERKTAKKLQQQAQREHTKLLLKVQPKANNVTMITQDIANKIVRNTIANTTALTSSPQNICVNNTNFPALGERRKVVKNNCGVYMTNNTDTEEINVLQNNKKCMSHIALIDFINNPVPSSKQIKQITGCATTYNGNTLDSDLPVRKKGKYKEIGKVKRPSKLKQNILRDKSECEASNHFPALIQINTEEKINTYPDHVITEEFNVLINNFVSAIVVLQEKLYKRDPIKGKSKRRYVLGLHEVQKYIKLNKIKIIIMAPDINLVKQDGALSNVLNGIIDMAKTNDIPYLFALKRRLLGKLTLKFIPVSCIAILNYEGLEDQFNFIMETLVRMKSEYKQLQEVNKTATEEDVNTELTNKLIYLLK